MRAVFKIGDRVCLSIDNGKVGVVISLQQNPLAETQYQVFHDADNINTYFEGQLCLVDDTGSNTVTLQKFQELYASRKLGLNSLETLFSLNTGKIEFIPFQFRPLTRILRAELPRILIADEVGVGKTIETGIILKEFEKREGIDSVIIICPKDLTAKWRLEMKTKFDESFEILSSDRLNYCFSEMEMEGVWPYESRKCIIGLEMLRREENIVRIEAMEDVISFDMLVVDEAHHVINPNSKSHQVVEYFCRSSEIAVFLSATPLQLGSSDLFSLLNLLLPEEFIDESVFSAMAEPNRFINAAIRAIRDPSSTEWREKASKELSGICMNDWAARAYKDNRLLNYWIEKLRDESFDFTDEIRLSCLRDIESLHTFAHVINRTKRKDIGAFTIREPITVLTHYDSAEQAFYDAARSFKYSTLCKRYGNRTATFIMSTIERQITSSLPAFVSLLDSFITRGLLLTNELSDDLEEDDDKIRFDDEGFLAWAKELKHLATTLPKTDLKARELLRIIDDTLHQKPQKLLVFSFFKHTLRYLYGLVADQGYRVGMITGDTSVEERAELRRRFRLDHEEAEAIDVLLCSEVGCEGLDYEFCSRMVNYDIPWNPMKIEQRIGRIDRFGQKSPKVQIYNFVTDGTIEERIFYRCYERLGVFNATIGDLEGVLGEMASELSAAAFDYSLTEAQQQAKAQQSIDNAIRLSAEEQLVENASRNLFLMDIENNDKQLADERLLQMQWQKCLLKAFFRREYPDSVLSEISDSSMKLRMYKEDKTQMLSRISQLKRTRKLDRNSQQVIALENYLSSDEQTVLLDLDPSTEKPSWHGMVISATHPFIFMALSTNGIQKNRIMTACKTYDHTYLEKGSYMFSCVIWKECGYKRSCELKVLLFDMEKKELLPISLDDFERLILTAEGADLESAISTSVMDSYIFENQQLSKTRLVENNEDIISRKQSTLHNYYSNQIEKANHSYQTATNEKIRRMYRARVQRLTDAWEEKKAQLAEKSKADILIENFAYGLIEVQ